MKASVLSLLRWPWLRLAIAVSLVAPWIAYSLAGYIQADSQIQSFAGGVRWMRPRSDVLPIATIVAFFVIVLVGLTADAFRSRRRRVQ